MQPFRFNLLVFTTALSALCLGILCLPPVFAYFFSYDNTISLPYIRYTLLTTSVLLFLISGLLLVFRRSLQSERIYRLFQNGWTLIIAIFVALTIGELSLRALAPMPNGDPNHNLVFQPDTLLGWTFFPNITTTITWPFESQVEITTNPSGYRDSSIDTTLPFIAVLGDSFVSALEVEREDRFTELIEQETGRHLQNYGVNGFGPVQSYLQLKRDVLPLNPKRVIYMLYVRNDFYDVTGAHDWLHTWIRNFQRPVATMSNDSLYIKTIDHQAVVDTTEWKRRIQEINKNPIRPEDFHLYNLIQFAQLQERRSQLTAPEVSLLAMNPDSVTQRGIDLTKQLVLRMNDLCRTENIPFSLVIAPTFVQVYPELWNQLVESHNLQKDEYQLNGINNLMAEFSKEHHIPVVDLYPALRSKVDEEQLYFKRNAHWTPSGHRVVGDRLATFIDSLSSQHTLN